MPDHDKTECIQSNRVGSGLRQTLLVVLSMLISACSMSDPRAPESNAITPDVRQDETARPLLTRIRQLTFEGRRAGEGYFSADGNSMVFQSERLDDNPFYQIYVIDLTTGDSQMLSTGSGKTTCAFIHPQGQDVLFASSHDDPEAITKQQAELEFRASGQQRRYSWDYEAEMDIWVRNGTGDLKELAPALGYDAEGSYSPDGEWITFASNRAAFATDLTDKEQKLLEIDPSYFIELYRMRSDGSELQRLTENPGYDGGPFYFPDGSRIVWRRFTEDGLMADIFSARADGSDVRQLTDFGAMSWAPYVHPSGEYLFFASNKLGFSNFEIYLVDVDGEKEPLRVTESDGFDGLPVPHPNGRMLSWTSTRHGGDGGQIYLANWDHEAAMARLNRQPDRD